MQERRARRGSAAAPSAATTWGARRVGPGAEEGKELAALADPRVLHHLLSHLQAEEHQDNLGIVLAPLLEVVPGTHGRELGLAEDLDADALGARLRHELVGIRQKVMLQAQPKSGSTPNVLPVRILASTVNFTQKLHDDPGCDLTIEIREVELVSVAPGDPGAEGLQGTVPDGGLVQFQPPAGRPFPQERHQMGRDAVVRDAAIA
mmetsp:Transcript_149810/g.481201  ORF Transcript_149810/g.481201 Transcript_149810/m.481201 type:complete len:205 (-) Transcript_149810:382-996(-)